MVVTGSKGTTGSAPSRADAGAGSLDDVPRTESSLGHNLANHPTFTTDSPSDPGALSPPWNTTIILVPPFSEFATSLGFCLPVRRFLKQLQQPLQVLASIQPVIVDRVPVFGNLVFTPPIADRVWRDSEDHCRICRLQIIA